MKIKYASAPQEYRRRVYEGILKKKILTAIDVGVTSDSMARGIRSVFLVSLVIGFSFYVFFLRDFCCYFF
jgi:hypothetical protein